jgi:hypothetical protein
MDIKRWRGIHLVNEWWVGGNGAGVAVVMSFNTLLSFLSCDVNIHTGAKRNIVAGHHSTTAVWQVKILGIIRHTPISNQTQGKAVRLVDLLCSYTQSPFIYSTPPEAFLIYTAHPPSPPPPVPAPTYHPSPPISAAHNHRTTRGGKLTLANNFSLL